MRKATGPGASSGRRLQIGVLVAGLIGTALVAGSLAFTRAQTESYRQQLDRIDLELDQPVQQLEEVQGEFRRTQDTFAAGTRASSSQQAAPILAQALTETGESQRRWAQFKATPARLEGEQAARDAVDAAIAANSDVGEPLGLAVLATSPDAALIAQLKVAQNEASDQVQVALEHLRTNFYRPALNREIVDLSGQAERTNSSTSAGLALAIALGLLLTLISYRKAARVEMVAARERDLQDQTAAENALDAQLQHALDMADTEDRVFGVIGRALKRNDGGSSADFLLADSSVAPFSHMVSAVDHHGGRCPVGSPNECPAAKHGLELVIKDSRALDACAYLLERDTVPNAAVCTPVSIAGRTIGVVHEAYLDESSAPPHRVRELEIIARKAGERLGMLRAFAQSETQARTDPLTGLLNRRSLEDAVARLNDENLDYTVAFADLDHFKVVNDTYGHDVGDRALRLFCTVLRTNMRPDDIVSRYGGEEFVVVLPRCTPDEAIPVLQRVQLALAETERADGVPTFTVSIGVASTHRGGTFEEIVSIADGCVLHAKDQGRNRIVVAGVTEPFIGPASAPIIGGAP